jgi:hypothetical protein
MNLSQQLKSLADKVVYAETTMSEYYKIGSITVRVSDHMSSDMDCDLAVFGSKDANGKHYVYTVIPMVGTFKEVQWFTNTNAVIEFITRFESIARLLIKSPTHNNNQRERQEFNAANKIVMDSSEQPANTCKNQIKFDHWMTKLASLYAEKGGALKNILNEIYRFSGNEETLKDIMKIVCPVSHERKKLCLDAMLARIKMQ